MNNSSSFDERSESSLESKDKHSTSKASKFYASLSLVSLFIAYFSQNNFDALSLHVIQNADSRTYILKLSLLTAGILLASQEFCHLKFSSYDQYRLILRKALSATPNIRTFYIIFIASVAEELFFRLALQPFLGIVTTGILTALMHFNRLTALGPVQALTFINSCLLGLLFDQSQSIYPGILVHMCASAFFLFRATSQTELKQEQNND